MAHLGVDIIEISRIGIICQKWGERFLHRIYTERELAFSRGRIPQLAGRFAAKEAVMKALGTGTRGVSWKEIEVVRKRGGPPNVILHGRAKARAMNMRITNISLSTSHSRDYAIAMVIGEQDEISNH